MGNVKNLTDEEAIEKIKEFAEGKMCLFCTVANGKIISRPMSTAQVEANGDIWFFSPKDSDKNRQLQQHNEVYLMYMEAKKQHYLTLNCTAEIVQDKAKVDELWNGWLNAWFDGKDDPNITLLRVRPEEGHYWDEKENHFISMVKTGIAALTGTKGMDGSLEGDINI